MDFFSSCAGDNFWLFSFIFILNALLILLLHVSFIYFYFFEWMVLIFYVLFYFSGKFVRDDKNISLSVSKWIQLKIVFFFSFFFILVGIQRNPFYLLETINNIVKNSSILGNLIFFIYLIFIYIYIYLCFIFFIYYIYSNPLTELAVFIQYGGWCLEC